MCSDIEETGKGDHNRAGDGHRWPLRVTTAREKREARGRGDNREIRIFNSGVMAFDMQGNRRGGAATKTETARRRRSPVKPEGKPRERLKKENGRFVFCRKLEKERERESCACVWCGREIERDGLGSNNNWVWASTNGLQLNLHFGLLT